MEKLADKVLSVDSSFITKNLPFLSALNTDCMAEDPWNETWSNNLDGVDPRTNSPAMWRHLIELGCKFYVILDDVDLYSKVSNENFKGIGVLLPKNLHYIKSMEWTKELLSKGVAVNSGDWSMDLFLVNPKYRGQGVLRSLGSEMNEYLNTLPNKQNLYLWMQTRVKTVFRFAEEMGFSLCQSVYVKHTERKVLRKALS